jgi:hypothetical protein
MNIIAIVAAGGAAFMVGALWYGLLFSKPWQAATGMSDAQIQSGNMPLIFGLTLLFEIAMAAMLAHMFARLGQPAFHVKMMMSTGIALAFVIPAMGINYLYLRKRAALFFIDAGHWLAVFAVMGLVLALL